MKVSLRPHQEAAVKDIDEKLAQGYQNICCVQPTGSGKCHGKDTPILMYDGTIKMVQDVIVGDLLMGPDSKPRQVLSLARGREELFKVTPVKGESYVVNKSHILSLKKTGVRKNQRHSGESKKGEIVNISITDYLASSKHFKHTHKGWRSAVDFNNKITSDYLPPYLLGLWLGDGNSRTSTITTADNEVFEYLNWWCLVSDQDLRKEEMEGNASSNYHITAQGRRSNTTKQDLKKNNLILNKHIPHEYKTSDRQSRLELLAGIIDSDGHLSNGCYDLVFKSELLAKDIVFVARSLGFAAYMKECEKTCTNTGAKGVYFRISISGDVSLIPTKLKRHKPDVRKQIKDVLVTGIQVQSIGFGEYFGFEITGDHLYLLGDFTVTHNTILKAYYAHRAYQNGEVCVLIAHRDVLLGQISNALCLFGVPHSFICSENTVRDITNMNYKTHGDHWHDPRSRIIVISVATFASRLKDGKIPQSLLDAVKWWLMDETHHLTVGSQWGLCIENFPNACGIGVTATPIRGDRKGLGRHASGYFDVLSCTTSMIKLVKAGMLTRMKVYQPDILDLGDLKVTASGDYNADKAYLKVKNQLKHIHGNAIEYYKRFVHGQPVITFGFNIEHGKEIARLFNEAGIPTMFVSSKSKESVRRQAVEDLRSGKLWNLVNVDLFGEGFDAPAVAGIFMLRKTESYSLYKQQIGRCLRPSEGKEYGYVFDHVGNVALMMMKYGLPSPYHDPEWTLDNVGKVSKKNGDDTPLPRTYECPKCSYEGPLKDVFDEDGELLLKGFMQDDGSYICPDEDCRHVFGDDEDKAVAKRIQEQKKGNLVELTFDVEQEFIRRRDEEVFKPVSELDKGEYAAANMHRHVNRQNAITVLQHKINKWCNGLYKETGWPSDMIRKEFFITFGINIFEAQVLSAPKAEELARKVQQDDFRRSKTLSAQG